MQRLRRRQGLSWVAIYAVALHAILTGFAPVAAATAVDPFTVICHSGAAAPDGTPDGLVPGKACEHCNLCSSTTPPVPPVVVLSLIVAPARILAILTPTSAAVPAGTSNHPNFARGPPSFV